MIGLIQCLYLPSENVTTLLFLKICFFSRAKGCRNEKCFSKKNVFPIKLCFSDKLDRQIKSHCLEGRFRGRGCFGDE